MKVLIACFPKSGSTYLSRLIANLPDFTLRNYVPAFGRREQELSESEILMPCETTGEVAQHHVRASEYTLSLVNKYNLTPVVLVRNIFDACVSLADHMKNESVVFPMAFFDTSVAHLSFDERLDAVLDLAVPWYINFYVSWWRARPNAIVTYEDVVLAGHSQQLQFLNSIGLQPTRDVFETAVDALESQFTRFNVGKALRGTEVIDQAKRHDLMTMCRRYYPDVDFSPIGIIRPWDGGGSEGE